MTYKHVNPEQKKHNIFQKEEYLHAILNSIIESVITINIEGTIVDINAIGEKLFGYSSGELIGSNLTCLLPELTPTNFQYLFTNNLDINTAHEINGIRKDGSPIILDLSVSEVKLKSDKYAVLLLRDITAKKKLESKVHRSEKIKSMVTDACLDAMVTVNMDGYVQEYNTAAEQLFGWKREEITGQLMENFFIPEEMRESHRNGMLRFKKEGKGPLIGNRVEIEAINKSGERFPVELALVATEIDGERLATAFIRDISDRKHAEAELIATRDAAEEASQAKSRFLSHMSHEIRSPLNAVLCSVNLIAERLKDPSHLRLLQTAKTSGHALLAVINEVLDFSKIEAGHLSIISDKTNLFSLIEDVLNSAQARLESSDVDLLYFVDLAINQITTDPVRFRQILNVLVDNAIKFTKKGVVSVTVLPITLNSGKTAIRVSVFDTGVGIPGEHLPSVFNEFEQVDATIDSRYGGTGLGLTIARKLVELLNGNIYVTSELYKGSCFSFIIPVTIETCDINKYNFSLKKIIFITPNNELRKELAEQLKQIGNQYFSFSSLKELHQAIMINDICLDHCILIVDERTPGLLFQDNQKNANLEWLPHNSDHSFCVCTDWAELNPPFSSFKRVPKPLSLNLIFKNMAITKEETESPTDYTDQCNAGHLLLVEDVAANRLVAGEMLRSRGFDVKTANDGEEALYIAMQDIFDVILMDIRMPKMNGYEATKAIRYSKGPNAETPIIALTANAERNEIEKCLQLGMNDFVSKPFDVDNLLKAIKRCHSNNSSQNKLPDALEQLEDRNNEPLLEQSILNQLIKDTSQESLVPLLNMFITELDTRYESIDLAVDVKDFDVLREEAHALKSCSGTFGASKLQRLAMQLEYAAKDYDTSLVNTIAAEFQSTLLATRDNYQDYLKKKQ
ncbi:PAS domain S-box protein [Zooshikella sp. RANM57]|uniref:PAS domain S-box protein n=1 Tax=Zooshikella sp. RANM57 TaxID=3425863 RepID=UPI003D6E56F8